MDYSVMRLMMEEVPLQRMEAIFVVIGPHPVALMIIQHRFDMRHSSSLISLLSYRRIAKA